MKKGDLHLPPFISQIQGSCCCVTSWSDVFGDAGGLTQSPAVPEREEAFWRLNSVVVKRAQGNLFALYSRCNVYLTWRGTSKI